MNAYGVLILAALLLEYAAGVVADLLNLRALRPEPPAELADLYDAETYRRSQEYTRARTRFGLVPATVHLVALLGFWFAGGFAALDAWARGLGLGTIGAGLVFVATLVLLRTLLSLPFRWWSTFVIEERFGFNRTTPRTFWTDVLKGLLLAAALGLPLLALVIWFFERTGDAAWLWCWAVAAAWMLVVQFVAPTWILPLFNRFEPLEEGSLRAKILAYTRSVGFPLEGLFVIDGSRRSAHANAFFTGFGKRKRIALFDTLIDKADEDEIVAVVAHEVGHYEQKHVQQGLAIGIAHAGAMFWLLGFFLREPELFAAFGIGTPSVAAGLVFFGLLFTPVEMVLSVALQALSRRNEFAADRFAVRTTGRAEPLIGGLKTLARESLSNLTPHPFHVLLHHSHPPLVERVAALRAAGGRSRA